MMKFRVDQIAHGVVSFSLSPMTDLKTGVLEMSCGRLSPDWFKMDNAVGF